MPDTKVSALTDGTTANSTDRIPVARDAGGGTFNNRYVTPGYIGTTLLGSGTALTGSTVTTSSPVLNLTQTWNDGAVTFTGLRFNVTNTASANASKLFDFQVGGTSRFEAQVGNTVVRATGYYYDTTVGYYISDGANGSWAAGSFRLINSAQIGWVNSSNANSGTADLFLTRAAAATLQLGAADAAAPVAQTLLIQSGSGTDINGVAFNIGGSKSTGTGTAGLVNIQTSSRGAASGTSQNVLATVASFGPNTLSGSQAISLLDMAQTWNTTGAPIAISLNVTNTASGANAGLMNLQIGGNSKFFIGKSNLSFANSLGGNAVQILGDQANGYPDWGYNGVSVFAVGGNAGTRQIALASSAVFGWTNATSNLSGSIDTSLARDAANTLALRNGTNAQTFRVYGTTSGGNSSFLSFYADPTGYTSIYNDTTGSGTFGSMFIVANAIRFQTGTSYAGRTARWQINDSGHFIAETDNTYDIGASGTTSRVRTIYSGGGYSAASPTIKTANYTQLEADYSLIFNGTGSITLTLLAAATYPGKILYVKTIAAQTVVSASSNVKPIDTNTAGTAILAATAGKWAMLQSDGTNWVIMAQG